MSYDIWTECEHCGTTLFHIDPTYNLGAMFREALGGEGVRDLNGHSGGWVAEKLETAIADMEARPEHYRQFDPPNGWGDYDGAVEVLNKIRAHAAKSPETKWRVT